ncbi:MAG: hypothetical protein ACTSRS_18910 [Candidatus Helarchaeota archaeon]
MSEAVRPFVFVSNPLKNLKYYCEDEETYFFYLSILMFLKEAPLNLIQLNSYLFLLSRTGMLGEFYREMDIADLFFHSKIAIINLGDSQTKKSVPLTDWDSFVLERLRDENGEV